MRTGKLHKTATGEMTSGEMTDGYDI